MVVKRISWLKRAARVRMAFVGCAVAGGSAE